MHRDIKPANVLLDPRGAPLLTDFDLVAADGSTGGTRTGALGTFLYASPEVMANPQTADARADVYGLGMTALFALHGADLPLDVLRDPYMLLRVVCPENKRLRVALSTAIDFDPAQRFPDAAAMCDAIEYALENPTAEASVSPAEPIVGSTYELPRHFAADEFGPVARRTTDTEYRGTVDVDRDADTLVEENPWARRL